MPEICRFYGIIIRVYLIDNEHPPRYIHIKYGNYEAIMELINLNIIEGNYGTPQCQDQKSQKIREKSLKNSPILD